MTPDNIKDAGFKLLYADKSVCNECCFLSRYNSIKCIIEVVGAKKPDKPNGKICCYGGTYYNPMGVDAMLKLIDMIYAEKYIESMHG